MTVIQRNDDTKAQLPQTQTTSQEQEELNDTGGRDGYISGVTNYLGMAVTYIPVAIEDT